MIEGSDRRRQLAVTNGATGTQRLVTLGLLLALSLLAASIWYRRSSTPGLEPPPSLAPAVWRPSNSRVVESGARVQPVMRGIVLTTAGAPARASVMAVRADLLSADAPRWLSESGADGRFVLTELPPGHYEVWAWAADGYGTSTSCDVASDTTEVELRLEPSGAPTHGIVRDAAGGTVASAELRVMHVNAGLDRPVALARSDTEGRYRLRLPPGNYLARVSASGYALTQRVLQVGRQGAEQDFVLNPAAAVTGRVVRQGGAVAPNVSLTLRPARLDTLQAQFPRAFSAQRDGTFSVRDVPPGNYLLVAETGHESATFGPFQLNAGEEKSDVDLMLAEGQKVRVEVVADAGQPVNGATIEVKQDRAGVPSRNVSAQSDAHGVAEVSGLFVGHSTLVLIDHADFEQHIEPLAASIAQDEARIVRVTLRRATRLAGRVLSPSGLPVAGARVSVQSGRPGGAYTSGASDEKGEFALRVGVDTNAAASYLIEARHPAHGLARLVLSSAAQPLILSLSPGLYVDGAVRDERGAAVPFARVSAMQIEPRVAASQALDIADAEGAFHIGPFETGIVRVELQGAIVAAPSSRATAQVDLRSGQSGTATLIAPARLAKVSGRVLDEHGEPLVGVTVLVAPERFGAAARTEGNPAVTDASGAFECEGLSSGPHRVFVEALGYASVERPIVAPGALEIRLDPSSAMLGRATSSSAAAASAQEAD